MRRMRTAMVAAGAIVAGMVGLALGSGPAAMANPVPAPSGVGAPPPDAQVVLGPSSADVGQTVRGFTGPASFDPVAAGYPAAVPNPPAGFVPAEGGALLFAGTIAGTGPAGGTAAFYCVDLNTDTYVGLGYDAATWSAADIVNMGYINRIITSYYPQTSLPAGAVSNAQRAAAVQAAIWFFSDRFVLSTAGSINAALYPLVAGIVSAVRAAGPLNTEPPLPAVTIAGPAQIIAGQVSGPYTVQTNATEATITITGADAFTDAAGTTPLTSPATLPAGATFYLRTDTPGSVSLAATATATARAGSNALYHALDPDNPDPATAQTLVLAHDAPVNVTAERTIVVVAPASPSAQPSASATVSTSPTPSLPTTGTSLGPIVLVGLSSLAAGLLLWGATYRRRRA